MGKEGDKPLFLVKNKRLVYRFLVQVFHCMCLMIQLLLKVFPHYRTGICWGFLEKYIDYIYRYLHCD
jgi:hypothetical protein